MSGKFYHHPKRVINLNLIPNKKKNATRKKDKRLKKLTRERTIRNLKSNKRFNFTIYHKSHKQLMYRDWDHPR